MDAYARIVATVIAVALSIIALQNAGVLPSTRQSSVITEALAQDSSEPRRVEICSWDDALGRWRDCARVHGGRLIVGPD